VTSVYFPQGFLNRFAVNQTISQRFLNSMSPPPPNDFALLLRFRRYFLPFLLPAAALLIVALIQANLTLAAARQGQQLLDLFLHSAPATPHEQARGVFLMSELSGALQMAGWLVAAATVGVCAGQARSAIHGKFTLRLQEEIVDRLSYEDGESRAARQSGATLRSYVSDAPSLSALLIFGIVGIGEHLVRLLAYVIGILSIPGGWRIVLVVGGLGFLLQTGVVKMFARGERSATDTVDRLNENLFNKATRYFEILERLLFFGGERSVAEEMSRGARDAMRSKWKSTLLSASREAISGILATISLPLTVLLLLGSPGFSPGSVVQAQMLVNLFLMSVAALCATPATLRQFGPSLQRINALLEIPRVADPPQASLIKRDNGVAVRLSGLGFGFSGSGKNLFSDLNLTIPAGALVGWVGRSGCGKSTLAKLLVGDLRSTAGSVYLDELDITDWPLHWRRQLIGYLPTGFGFLDGTLEQNILFGRPKEAIGDFQSALDLSGVTDLLKERAIDLQYKIRSLTGEGFLSFGQRRRISLAQLLSGKHRLLIFDEPGASLDPQSRRKIAQGLRQAVAGRTTILITHDPDIFETDFNFFFQEGRIADIGSHADLLRRSAQYAELMNAVIAERGEGGSV
jgi:ABC-type bacteriocin/lantibiotic exporter with double-glycine peptidase domain